MIINKGLTLNGDLLIELKRLGHYKHLYCQYKRLPWAGIKTAIVNATAIRGSAWAEESSNVPRMGRNLLFSHEKAQKKEYGEI